MSLDVQSKTNFGFGIKIWDRSVKMFEETVKISKLLEKLNENILYVEISNIRSNTRELVFENIEFDDFFVWNEEKAFIIGSNDIESINSTIANKTSGVAT